MELRVFRPRDEADYLAFSADFYSGDAALTRPPQAHFQNTFREALAGSPLLTGYIIEEDGKSAGYALVTFTWNTELGGKIAILDELYIAPRARGKKVGSAFLTCLLQDLTDVAAIRLEVCEKNPRVQRLYASFGFEELPYRQMVWKRK